MELKREKNQLQSQLDERDAEKDKLVTEGTLRSKDMESLKNKCYGHTSELAKELIAAETCITTMLKEIETLKENQLMDKKQIEGD